MTKKTGIFDVNIDSTLFQIESNPQNDFRHPPRENIITINDALKIISKQMKIQRMRERTITDYNYQLNRFQQEVNVKYLHEITNDKIYEWLSMMDIQPVSKLNRLKVLKAFLSRCFDNGWYESKFWTIIRIRIDKEVKQGASERDLQVLLSLLDTSTFIGFRDATAILTMYKTGIRAKTLALLEERHIDFDTNTLVLTGDILKNHKVLKLPIDEQLSILLKQLIKINDVVRKENNKRNKYVFITLQGNSIDLGNGANAITKQLYKYSKRYGLKNINAHAIRRAYAKNLLNKGVPVPMISKALGHANLEVTTQYLDINPDEVANTLRDFL